MAEKPAGSIEEMSSHVAEELLKLNARSYVLFGHSLGALVAYETAVILQDNAKPAGYLLVSGAPAPWYAGGGTKHLLSDDKLWEVVTSLGGIDVAIAGDIELRDLLLPILRLDVKVNETYQPSSHVGPLSCPVYCYHNTEDPLVGATELSDWARTSTGQFTLRTRSGGHFQFLSDTTELVGDIVAALAEKEVTG
jgi:pyochelin biosynthetic protein PchC